MLDVGVFFLQPFEKCPVTRLAVATRRGRSAIDLPTKDRAVTPEFLREPHREVAGVIVVMLVQVTAMVERAWLQASAIGVHRENLGELVDQPRRRRARGN